MTTRTDRKLALAVGGALALLCILGAAVQVASWTIGSRDRTRVRTITGPVTQVIVDARGGDVSIVPWQSRDVKVETDASGSIRVPPLRSSIVDQHVHVTGGCPNITIGHCSASIIVHVPATTPVQVTAGTGDVTIDGVSAAVSIRTGSGDVSADNLSGTVTLQSRSGDVVARDLDASVVHAQTTSGDVNLAFTKAPFNVDAQTASGDALIEVPPGRQAYQVDVASRSGDESVGVREDPHSDMVLRAHTGSGDAVVDYSG
jgi:DUF4097 and DUF4098 domain-containing protein YvlB